jgi:hypothetical protein
MRVAHGGARAKGVVAQMHHNDYICLDEKGGGVFLYIVVAITIL